MLTFLKLSKRSSYYSTFGIETCYNKYLLRKMANSFEELIFSRDPESQNGRKQKCFKYCAILLLAFGVFIIPYAIAKVEISAFKNEIREEINGLKMKEREQLKNEMVDFTKNDNLQNEVGELKREITKLKSNEEAHQNEIN